MTTKDRRQREKTIRREQILTAARKVFSVRGLKYATMEQIAKEAELSPGTIYFYFKNKDELYASLNLRILSYMVRKFEDLRDDKNKNAEQKMDALKGIWFDIYQYDPLILRSMIRLQASEELFNMSNEFLAKLNSLNLRASEALSQVYRDGVREGVFTEFHPRIFTDVMWGVFSGLVLWEESKRMADASKDYLRKTLDVAFEIFYRGISNHKMKDSSANDSQSQKAGL